MVRSFKPKVRELKQYIKANKFLLCPTKSKLNKKQMMVILNAFNVPSNPDFGVKELKGLLKNVKEMTCTKVAISKQPKQVLLEIAKRFELAREMLQGNNNLRKVNKVYGFKNKPVFNKINKYLKTFVSKLMEHGIIDKPEESRALVPYVKKAIAKASELNIPISEYSSMLDLLMGIPSLPKSIKLLGQELSRGIYTGTNNILNLGQRGIAPAFQKKLQYITLEDEDPNKDIDELIKQFRQVKRNVDPVEIEDVTAEEYEPTGRKKMKTKKGKPLLLLAPGQTLETEYKKLDNRSRKMIEDQIEDDLEKEYGKIYDIGARYKIRKYLMEMIESYYDQNLLTYGNILELRSGRKNFEDFFGPLDKLLNETEKEERILDELDEKGINRRIKELEDINGKLSQDEKEFVRNYYIKNGPAGTQVGVLNTLIQKKREMEGEVISGPSNDQEIMDGGMQLYDQYGRPKSCAFLIKLSPSAMFQMNLMDPNASQGTLGEYIDLMKKHLIALVSIINSKQKNKSYDSQGNIVPAGNCKQALEAIRNAHLNLSKKYLGRGMKGGFSLKSLGKKAFKFASNQFRKRFCNGKSRPLLDGELHYGCHNFTGPGTRIDLPEVAGYPPYNDIDNCSRTHDIQYLDAIKKGNKQSIRDADIEAVNCYNMYPNEDGYLPASLGINGKMALENVLPMVAKSILGNLSGKGKKKGKGLTKQDMQILKQYGNMGHDIYNEGPRLERLSLQQAKNYDSIDRGALKNLRIGHRNEGSGKRRKKLTPVRSARGGDIAYENNRVKPMSAYPNTYQAY